MKKLVLIFLLLSVWCSSFIAQQTQTAKQDIEKIILPVLNNDGLQQKEERRYASEGAPIVFASSHRTKISPENQGTWTSHSNGLLSWSLKIKSAGAYSLNLGFTDFHLPGSARLFFYSNLDQSRVGPFTWDDNEEHGQFWSPIIEGDELQIELFITADDLPKLQLELSYVNHDFLGIGKSISSGSCNLDVACSAADGWPEVDLYRDIIRSAGAYFFQSPNGSSICSGALINNARQDCTPYFLTANHCGINQNNAASMVFVWNYENSYCRQPDSPESGLPGDGQKTQFNSGAILRVNYEPTDVTLVEMDDPVDPAFKTFFAGWNAQKTLPQSTVCIHHPGVEEKRISFDYDASVIEEETHIRVLDWDIGTTEGGSSGSPLYNEKKQIVGQLTGGFAACGNEDYDSFGWLYKSWEGGGTSDTRLKDWLDPDNSGILQMNGRDCGFGGSLSEALLELCAETSPEYSISIMANEFVDTTLYIKVIDAPVGLSVALEKDSLYKDDKIDLSISNLDQLNSGSYSVTLQLNSHNDSILVYLNLLLTKEAPIAPEPVNPSFQEMGVHNKPSFEWESDEGVSWSFQLAEDIDFQNVLVEEEELTSTQFSSPQLLENETQYFWRVKASNICGESPWSTVFEFTTGKIQCFSFYATDLPSIIDDNNEDTIESELFIPVSPAITDLNVIDLTGNHSWIQDLHFELIHPTGERVTLLSQECGSDQNFDFSIDDDILAMQISCPLSQGLTYPSANSFSTIEHQPARGWWVLHVEDRAAFDGGSLESWGLQICLDVTGDFSILAYPENLSACNQEVLETEIFVGTGFSGPVNFSALDIPQDVNFSPNPASPGETVNMQIQNLDSFSSGEYNFRYTATDGVNSTEQVYQFTVDNGPTPAVLSEPADGTDDTPLDPLFSWMNVAGVQNYIFELAADQEFTEILESVELQDTQYQSEFEFDELTRYYWRVLVANDCGMSSSDIFSFETNMNSSILELSENQVLVYPNPAKDRLYISFDTAIPQGLEVMLKDISGKIVLSNYIKSGGQALQLDLSNQVPGAYILILRLEDHMAVDRIIIH